MKQVVQVAVSQKAGGPVRAGKRSEGAITLH